MMHNYGMMGDMSMMGPSMWIFMLLLWGFALIGLICTIRWIVFKFRHNTDKNDDSA